LVRNNGARTVEHGTDIGDGGSVREDKGEVCVEERERDGGGSNYREHLERSRAEGLQAIEVWRHRGRISYNLLGCLTAYSIPTMTWNLWIDQICIDQESIDQKSVQV
jgi:hypothetical protein